jgi:hypothetical protein
MRSFCTLVIEKPGACSPSRSVVSNTRMRSGSFGVTWGSVVWLMIRYSGHRAEKNPASVSGCGVLDSSPVVSDAP